MSCGAWPRLLARLRQSTGPRRGEHRAAAQAAAQGRQAPLPIHRAQQGIARWQQEHAARQPASRLLVDSPPGLSSPPPGLSSTSRTAARMACRVALSCCSSAALLASSAGAGAAPPARAAPCCRCHCCCCCCGCAAAGVVSARWFVAAEGRVEGCRKLFAPSPTPALAPKKHGARHLHPTPPAARSMPLYAPPPHLVGMLASQCRYRPPPPPPLPCPACPAPPAA